MADGLGGKLGSRVAQIASRAKLDTMSRSTPLIVKTGMALQDEFFKLTGFEVNRTVGPMWSLIAGLPDAPDWLRATGKFIAAGKGQFATLLASTTTGAVMGGGLMNFISNELNPAILPAIAANPHGILSPQDAAAVKALNIDVPWDTANEAAMGGLSVSRFDALVELRSATLSPADVQQLLNRGLIDGTEAVAALHRVGYKSQHMSHILALARQVISGADAADMAVKSVVTPDEAVALGEADGWDAQSMRRLMAVTGEPPGTDQVLQAWRRGIITEQDVDRGIAQSRVRTEWAPVIKALQWDPLSTPEAANATVQNHMSYVDAEREAALNGTRPEHFAIIVENAGRPPGPAEALQWLNRGWIDEPMFRQIFRESSLKDKYIDLYIRAREKLFTLGEIRLLYRDGAMSKEDAIAKLVQVGYTAADAATIVVGASHAKTKVARDLTEAQIMQLYSDRALSEVDTRAWLTGHGYDDHEATQIITLADLQRAQKFFNAAITHVRSQYVGRKIDQSAASATLDSLQVDPAARDDYLMLWTLERGVSTKVLSEAQIVAAVKKGGQTIEWAMSRLTGQGYSTDDAHVLLATAGLIGP